MICGLAKPGGRPTAHTALGLQAASGREWRVWRDQAEVWPVACCPEPCLG